jgi:hypothetical protein
MFFYTLAGELNATRQLVFQKRSPSGANGIEALLNTFKVIGHQ